MKKKEKVKNIPKKFVSVVKVGELNNGMADCVKHRFNSIPDYANFLDTTTLLSKNSNKLRGWIWIKVYYNTGEKKRVLFAYYNRKNPPPKK